MRNSSGESPPALWQLDTLDLLVKEANHDTLIWLMSVDLDFWLSTYGRVHDLINTLEGTEDDP